MLIMAFIMIPTCRPPDSREISDPFWNNCCWDPVLRSTFNFSKRGENEIAGNDNKIMCPISHGLILEMTRGVGMPTEFLQCCAPAPQRRWPNQYRCRRCSGAQLLLLGRKHPIFPQGTSREDNTCGTQTSWWTNIMGRAASTSTNVQ